MLPFIVGSVGPNCISTMLKWGLHIPRTLSTLSSLLKVVTLGCTEPQMAPASPVLPTVTLHGLSCLCVPALLFNVF